MDHLIELPYHPDPAPLLRVLRPFGRAALLHSSDRGHPDSRHDILCAAPSAWLETRGEVTRIADAAGMRESSTPPFAVLEAWHTHAAPPPGALPFSSGIIGLAGYDLGRPPAAPKPNRDRFPDLVAARYDWAIVSDHRTRHTWLVCPDATAGPSAELLAELLRPVTAVADVVELPVLRCETDQAAYASAFTRVQDYIRAGDCYQANLSVRFSGAFDGDALALYGRLSAGHPAPFAGFLDTPDGSVLSFSPERFLRIDGDRIETCPIKGTRPRDPDPHADRALGEALLASAKDRAENLMIVDLLRNDLGRSCVPGSIEVPQLFGLESFGSVHHLVSHVRGRLAAGVGPLEAFARCFPGGSITGAPKIRAMEIIDELEPHRRGPYCGSLFMLDGSGRLDSSITIRTLLHQDDRLYCWGGGGLVADSVYEEEWAEIHHKVGALIGQQPTVDAPEASK